MAIENTKKTVQEVKELFKNVNEEIIILDSNLSGVGAKIEAELEKKLEKANTRTKEFANTFKNDLTKSIESSRKNLDRTAEIQQKINKGQDASKEIEKRRNALEKERVTQQRKIEILRRDGIKISASLTYELEEYYEKELDVLDIQGKINEAQEGQLGIIGKLGKSISGVLNKLGLGAFESFFNFEKSAEKANIQISKIEEKMNKGVAKGAEKTLTQFQKSGIVTKELFKNIDKGALATAGLFKISQELFKLAISVDQKITDLSRNLSISKDEAKLLKDEMRATSLEGGLFGITISDQIEAVTALNKGLGGVALTFDKETNAAAAETLKRLKLSEESVGNMGVLALATGRSFEELEAQQMDSVLAAEEEFGIRMNLKTILDEANKITGQARINIEKFPGGLTKAVSVAKSLGVEMSSIEKSASTLLNFEESITKELEAEMLIGRDLNLEKARSAALAGDQETLMKELVNQAGSLEELQGMNVLAQDALAAALGLSSDELSNQLLTGEALATQADEQLARDKAAVDLQEKSLSASEMQATAMKKLADIFSIAVPILVGLAAAAAAMAVSLTAGLGAGLITKGIIKTSLAVGAGVAAATGIASSAIGDATIPPGGPFSITDTSKPFGSTVLTTKGDGIAVSPNIQQTGAGGDGSAKTNKLLQQLLNRPAPTINMDSIEVGTVAGMSAFPIQ